MKSSYVFIIYEFHFHDQNLVHVILHGLYTIIYRSLLKFS